MGYLESIRASCWCELLGLLPGARGGTGPQETSASTVVEFPPGTKKTGKNTSVEKLGSPRERLTLGVGFCILRAGTPSSGLQPWPPRRAPT